jgi:hypothetical protein
VAKPEAFTVEAADSRWSCARKKSYSEKLAQKVANRINYEKGTDLVPYGCTHCGAFHIGHRARS